MLRAAGTVRPHDGGQHRADALERTGGRLHGAEQPVNARIGRKPLIAWPCARRQARLQIAGGPRVAPCAACQ